jgi:hypothetical protein
MLGLVRDGWCLEKLLGGWAGSARVTNSIGCWVYLAMFNKDGKQIFHENAHDPSVCMWRVGHVYILHGDIMTQFKVALPANRITVTVREGLVQFAVNDTPLECARLRELTQAGKWRLGVSLSTALKRARLELAEQHVQNSATASVLGDATEGIPPQAAAQKTAHRTKGSRAPPKFRNRSQHFASRIQVSPTETKFRESCRS